MSNKRIEKYIPKAIELLGKEFNNGISSEKKAYITSFGPSVITAGLRNTLMLYKTKSEKEFILKYLNVLIKDDCMSADALIKDETFDPKVQEIYLDAITALKLASRILPKTKEEEEEEDQ